jgi:hypothetical protein
MHTKYEKNFSRNPNGTVVLLHLVQILTEHTRILQNLKYVYHKRIVLKNRLLLNTDVHSTRPCLCHFLYYCLLGIS